MLFQRVANWLAQEVIVKGLSESVWFQRLVLRTHTNVEKVAGEVHRRLDVDKIQRTTTQFVDTFSETLKKEMKRTK